LPLQKYGPGLKGGFGALKIPHHAGLYHLIIKTRYLNEIVTVATNNKADFITFQEQPNHATNQEPKIHYQAKFSQKLTAKY